MTEKSTMDNVSSAFKTELKNMIPTDFDLFTIRLDNYMTSNRR